MFPPNHKAYILSLYKNVLVESSFFFDDRARVYIKNRARKIAQEYKTCRDVDRVKYKIKEARKYLHRIEHANRGHQKSALKILEEVYGRNGKTRHALLYPFLHCHQPRNLKQPEPFVPHAPRTAPPPLICPPLQSLITQHLGKKLEPELPVPAYKPLHPGRKANLLWRHRSMLLDRVQLPLPFEILCELELKAGATKKHPFFVGKLMNGGPKWDDFYIVKRDMIHLDPTQVISKPKLLRTPFTLMNSPYATTTISLVNTDKITRPFDYSSRQKKRLYRRLLTDIPLTSIISPLQLWDNSISHEISKSHWVPQGVTLLLQDIPSDQVIEATLSKNPKKKVRRP